MHEFEKCCRFAVVINDTTTAKIEEQLGEATKEKIDSRTRFRKTLANLEKKANLETRLILNYIHPTPFHHINMEQSRHINRKKSLL